MSLLITIFFLIFAENLIGVRDNMDLICEVYVNNKRKSGKKEVRYDTKSDPHIAPYRPNVLGNTRPLTAI